ncbi:hypothetical protein PO883_18350 [Massilia sp. DJPM01]|uniref:hypothetical protein n=1 Tax=Massilia sp. DJPM01 TaxID=3024404 RepID=UPI00259F6276|nr:hypothetical protein [Massilia sp. DJPM01]MDM5179161.1 hypothetical protein [Massilia sp. DJPM01]
MGANKIGDRERRWRVAIAFLVAPGAPVCAISMFLLSRGLENEALSTAKVLTIFSYLAALFFGIPTYFALRKRNINSLKAYLACGFGIGMVSYLLIAAYLVSKTNFSMLVLRNTIGLAILATGCSIFGSLVFWSCTRAWAWRGDDGGV